MKLSAIFAAVPLWVRGIAAGAVLVAIVVGFKSCTATVNHKTDVGLTAARNEGAATARAEAAEEGIHDVVIAKQAAVAVARDDAARYDVCVRTARTPKACRPPAE